MMRVGLDQGDGAGARAARRRQLERAAGILEDELGLLGVASTTTGFVREEAPVDWEAIGRFAAQMEAERRATMREIEMSGGGKVLVCEQRPDLLAMLDYVTGYRP